jgi:hypothetical protein
LREDEPGTSGLSAHSGKRRVPVIVPEEMRHLTDGPRPGEVPGGAGTVSVLARGGSDAGEVLDRSRAVLLMVLERSGPQWPAAEEWRSLLPPWFVAACGPPVPREETQRWLDWWRALGPADRARAESERPWALEDWLYWLTPPERQWFWWDATAGDGTLRVTVEVPDWPAALGALDWLLRASGAAEVVHEDN